jgi:hypothetical protein
VDGDRIVWAEQVPGGWALRMATVRRRITPADLAALVQRMASTGEVRDAGTARTLAALLDEADRAQAAGDAAKERDALVRFRDGAQRQAGGGIAEPSAARLAELVNAMLPSFGGGAEGPGSTTPGTLGGGSH